MNLDIQLMIKRPHAHFLFGFDENMIMVQLFYDLKEPIYNKKRS